MSTTTRLTVAQYDRMIAQGVFDETAGKRPRIELIEGELLTMSPIGPRHEWIVDVLTEWSFESLPRRQLWVRVQNTVDIPELDSAPEPDITWVKRRHYRRRPQSADILLIIEVADSSVDFDCGHKADLYAAAGIADYWVVNIPGQCLHVFRQPQSGRYGSREILRVGAEARPLGVPEVALPVTLLFPPDDQADEN
ncbi:MAG: Uma2 family endonuclease [Planctomycetaceae bacterium]